MLTFNCDNVSTTKTTGYTKNVVLHINTKPTVSFLLPIRSTGNRPLFPDFFNIFFLTRFACHSVFCHDCANRGGLAIIRDSGARRGWRNGTRRTATTRRSSLKERYDNARSSYYPSRNTSQENAEPTQHRERERSNYCTNAKASGVVMFLGAPARGAAGPEIPVELRGVPDEQDRVPAVRGAFLLRLRRHQR